jgi:hypothetical protein
VHGMRCEHVSEKVGPEQHDQSFTCSEDHSVQQEAHTTRNSITRYRLLAVLKHVPRRAKSMRPGVIRLEWKLWKGSPG